MISVIVKMHCDNCGEKEEFDIRDYLEDEDWDEESGEFLIDVNLLEVINKIIEEIEYTVGEEFEYCYCADCNRDDSW